MRELSKKKESRIRAPFRLLMTAWNIQNRITDRATLQNKVEITSSAVICIIENLFSQV